MRYLLESYTDLIKARSTLKSGTYFYY